MDSPMARLVYRGGSPTDDNLTPRPNRDIAGRAGQAPGLSTWETLERAVVPGGKAQVIDLDALKAPLADFPDDPTRGGSPGHLSIATGVIDLGLLRDWALSRGSGTPHPLTLLIRDAIVNANVRRPR